MDGIRKRKRIGILSDTHGWLDSRVESALAGCDVLVHAGDIGGDDFLLTLSTLTDRLVVVAGNNDYISRWWSATGKQQSRLEEVAELSLPGGTLVVEHGHRIRDTRHYPARLRDKYPQARMIVFGHTHLQLIDQARESWVVNPGAAGRARTHGGPGCIVLTTDGDEWSLQRFHFKGLRNTA